MGFARVDHSRLRAGEIGGSFGGGEQDFGRVAGDMAGLRVAPLHVGIEIGHRLGPFHRLSYPLMSDRLSDAV
jgi:hypothetical protein